MGDKIEIVVAEYHRRLLAPDFDGFEEYYGCPVPSELRKFYALRERLLAGVLYVTQVTCTGPVRYDLIQYAEPMDRNNWVDRYGREFFRFATNTDGYGLLINPALTCSPVFADEGEGRSNPDIDALGFTLAEVVGTFGGDP